ncbi:MAG: response regulator transcription factor [Flavobacterium sp.]
MKLLLLEDDAVLSREIKDFFNAKNLALDTVFDGDLFFRQIKNNVYDVYLLDINVPKINGLDVCRKIREADKNTPILMLTAFGEIEDKVDAFQKGADDYLVKPFHLEELYIRSLALFRRKETPQNKEEIVEIGDLVINLTEKSVSRSNETINLTPKEFKLLQILSNAGGRIVSKQQIADELWDYHIETNQNTIEVYINFLRAKIDKKHDVKLIRTKIGYGYYLKAEDDD